MKRNVILALLILGLATACGSAKKKEAEQKRTQEKMERLEKDKQQFEKTNKEDLK